MCLLIKTHPFFMKIKNRSNPIKKMSNTISRVLYQMIIYLDLMSPLSSSDLPKTRRAIVLFSFGLASDGVYMCPLCCQRSGELLPLLSTLTKETLLRFISVALSLESPPPDVIWHPTL